MISDWSREYHYNPQSPIRYPKSKSTRRSRDRSIPPWRDDINERFSTKTTKTELLFTELMYDLLVTGGRCGVIVPDGVLFGTSNSTRKILVDKCKLEGVISMPSGVFKPYAGVLTAVLVFQKGGTTDNVWFYDMEADGFSLDDKRQKTETNDIPDIVEQWKNNRHLSESAALWRMSRRVLREWRRNQKLRTRDMLRLLRQKRAQSLSMTRLGGLANASW